MHVCQLELRLLADSNSSGAQANHYHLLHHSLQRAPNSPTAARSGRSPKNSTGPLVVSSLSPNCSCSALHTCRHLYSIDDKRKMSWQPSFYGTAASGGGHPPTVCLGQNLAHLPVSRPTMRSGRRRLDPPTGVAF